MGIIHFRSWQGLGEAAGDTPDCRSGRVPRGSRSPDRWRPAWFGTDSWFPDRQPSSRSFRPLGPGTSAVLPTRTPHRRATDHQVGRRSVAARDDHCW